MQFLEELNDMKLYSNKNKLYIPVDPSNRKKGALIMLLSSNSVDSHTMMNLPYLYNPNLYESFYIDSNISAFIDSGVIDDNEPIVEAMQHIAANKDMKISVSCNTDSTNDLKLLKSVFNEATFNKWYNFFRTPYNKRCTDIVVEAYKDQKTMAKENQKYALENKEVIDSSYSYDNKIICVALSGYEPLKGKNGKYDQYLLNELISFVCMKTSKKCDRFLANQIATVLSGQIDKYVNTLENSYGDIDDYALSSAYVIYKLYKEQGPSAIIRLCKTGDYAMLIKYSTRSFVRKIKTMYSESTLTSNERKNLEDSDFGLPSKKKYPMPDESHVRSAIAFFNHVDPEDEKELAKNINKKIKEFDMTVNVGENNRFRKYYEESMSIFDLSPILESVNIEFDKIAVGTDFHFIGYNDSRDKIIIKPKSYIEGIIEKENKIVGKDGIFIYLGDLFYKGFQNEYDFPATMKEEAIKYAKRFTGKYKILVKGNHDNLPDEFYIEKCGFTHVCSSLKYLNYLFTHQPEIVRDPIINIHGHIHGTMRYTENHPRNHMDVFSINKKHIDTLENILNAQKEYDSKTKQVANIDKADPHLYISGDALNLEDIVTESAVSYNPESLYSDILDIVDALSDDERNIIAVNGKYENSKNCIARFIKRDNDGNPIGFIDAYKFDSMPNEAQLVVALAPTHRGNGYMQNMLNDVVNHPINGYPGINKFVWYADPMNYSSVKLATSCGFTKTGLRRYREDLGIYEDRYEYNMPFRENSKIPLPLKYMNESEGYKVTDDYIINDSFITFFNGMDNQVISEAEKKYDSKLKQYLFKERLKNNKMVLIRYQEIKVMNPWIKKTFLKLSQYQRRNLFVDLSFYHALFLKNLKFNKDIAINMYWDFINRLILVSDYKDYYKRITIFIPVWAEAWDVKTAEELMDYRKSINPISMIIRKLYKSPNDLKKWGDKDIVFVSTNGYFKLNFNQFDLKDLSKFKRFISKLVNNENIVEDDESEYSTDTNANSAAVITANIVDKIETNAKIKIDDITGGANNESKPDNLSVLKTNAKYDHLRIRTQKIPVTNLSNTDKFGDKVNNSNAIFILVPDGDSAAETFNNNKLDINKLFNKRGYYVP